MIGPLKFVALALVCVLAGARVPLSADDAALPPNTVLGYSRALTLVNEDELIGSVASADGSVYALGLKVRLGAPVRGTTFVSKLDSAGNVAWTVTDERAGWPFAITLDDAGAAYVVGSYNSNGGPGFLLKVKPDGSGVEFFVQLRGQTVPNAITQAHSGDFYLAGYAFITGNYGQMTVSRIRPNGDLVWERYLDGRQPVCRGHVTVRHDDHNRQRHSRREHHPRQHGCVRGEVQRQRRIAVLHAARRR